ncbi:N-acyl-D-aspartate/D-glutamate deacylase [Bradyrhizobium sp. LB1.3]
MSNPDLVIRGGTVADGSGGELFEADVAITGGRISEIGKVARKGTGRDRRARQARHAGLR